MTVIDFCCYLLLTRKMNELEGKGCRFLFLFCLCEYRKGFVVQQRRTCIVWIIQYFLLWVPVWLRWRLLVCRHVWEMSFFYLMISINFQNLREISLIFFAKETLIFLLFFFNRFVLFKLYSILPYYLGDLYDKFYKVFLPSWTWWGFCCSSWSSTVS